MKKVSLFLGAVLVSLMVVVGGVSTAYAADTPTFVDGTESGEFHRFYANGTPITISAGTPDGTLITWGDDKSLLFTTEQAARLEVYGGYLNSTTVVDSNITMTGGLVDVIVGGGRGGSYGNPVHVGTATIHISGGTVTYGISGGGICKDASGGLTSSTSASSAYNVVDTANITIESGATGAGTATIYSGGMSGYCYVGSATINVSSGDWIAAIAGGSNGTVGSATINVSGGTFDNIHGNNRGNVGSFELDVTGGTIGAIYAGADIPVPKGGTLGSADISITGGFVGDVIPGYTVNGNIATDATVLESISIVADTNVITGTIEGFDVQNMDYLVTIDGTTYAAAKGQPLSANSWYSGIISKPGFKFEGFKAAGGTNLGLDFEVSGSVTLTTVFTPITGDSATPPTDDGKGLAATSDNSSLFGVGLVGISSVIVALGAFAARRKLEA